MVEEHQGHKIYNYENKKILSMTRPPLAHDAAHACIIK